MSIEVEATYEDGMLKPDEPLPLENHQRVRVVVQETTSVAHRSYGIIGWTGDPATVRKAALEPEHGVMESP
ncbi:MAG: antitoxin family protein [Planctomycetaceae bacterium]